MHSDVHERLDAISRARGIAIGLGVAMVALMAWTALSSTLLMPGVAACLLLPPAALVLVARWPALLTLWARHNTDIRLSLAIALITGVVVPIEVALKRLNVENLPMLVLPALVIGGSATAWALNNDPALGKRMGDAAAVAACLVMHAGALVLWLNHVLPPLEKRRTVVAVTDLGQNREHKGFTTFLVRTTTASTMADWEDYRVPHDVWKRLQVGAPACVDERRGLFGVTEAAISTCPAGAHAS